MDDALKRLLNAELQAEQVVQDAKKKREEITRKALREARLSEQRFKERSPEILDSFLEKARARSEQVIAELQRRYAERNEQLREMAKLHEEDAIEAALTVVQGGTNVMRRDDGTGDE